jgi:hypothetical protein
MSEHKLLVGGVEFRVDHENELEVTVINGGYDDNDVYRYLKKEEAIALRDMLNRWIESN